MYGNNVWFCVPFWKNTRIRLSKSHLYQRRCYSVPPVAIKLSVPHSPYLEENCPEARLWFILSDEVWSLQRQPPRQTRTGWH